MFLDVATPWELISLNVCCPQQKGEVDVTGVERNYDQQLTLKICPSQFQMGSAQPEAGPREAASGSNVRGSRLPPQGGAWLGKGGRWQRADRF